MASTSQAEDVPASASPAAAAAKMGSQDHIPPASSSPVEMSNLQSVEQSQSLQHGGERQEDTTAGAEDSTPAPEPSTSAEPSSPTPVPQPQEPTQPQPTLTRQQTEALGPATDGPLALPSSSADRGSALTITLMLTTGARHPYKIDEKYLKNRKVDSLSMNGSFDPREISGYKLKELIWTDWRTEWEPRPASPSSIRLIILGRFVEDKAALKGETPLQPLERSK